MGWPNPPPSHYGPAAAAAPAVNPDIQGAPCMARTSLPAFAVTSPPAANNTATSSMNWSTPSRAIPPCLLCRVEARSNQPSYSDRAE
jgi:hypothetical protein